jgi:hypothetical protein
LVANVKEKTMANKIWFSVGILAMVLVFGMTVVGCDNDTTGNGYTWTYINQSSHIVTIENSSFVPEKFLLNPGETKKIGSDDKWAGDKGSWMPGDLCNITYSGSEPNWIRTFTDN